MTTTDAPRDEVSVTFTLTDEQALLRDTVRDMLAKRATTVRVREVMLDHDGLDETLFVELAELALVGLTVPEAHGGAGSSFTEASIVHEEPGRRLAPVPLLSSAVLGATALQAAGSEAQLAEHLPEVAAGTTRLALAHLDARGRITADPGVTATRDGDGWVLEGTAGYVVDGAGAHALVTAATTDEGLALVVVPSDHEGVRREPIAVLDLTRPMATVTYERVRVDDGARLAGGDPTAALHHALSAGIVAVACEQVGGAQQVLADATAYANERYQFGRAIGSFQAVKHRLAEMLVEVESARSAAYHAARVLAAGDHSELAVAAPLAKAWCSEVYERSAAAAIQIHGGIGFTWEHDAHLYFKRAKASKLLLGDPHHHRARLGDVLGL